MESYKCEICGKKHEIFSGLEIPMPEKILEIPDEEKDKRIVEVKDKNYYVIDREIFLVRGEIFIYQKENENPFFNWSVWASISAEDFHSKRKELKSENNVEFKGRLETALPFYEKTQNLEAKIIFNSNYDYLIIEVEEPSQIKIDQEEGVTKDRIIEIMQTIYHNEKDSKFDKSFVERLIQNLDESEKEYLNKDKNFLIDISCGTVLFQIVNNQMLEQNNSKEKGFGFHLSFDESFESTKEELANFRNQEYSKKFDYHEFDEIPTYQIDLGVNKSKIMELVKQLIVDVYEQDVEIVKIENFEI